jgi:hypothetical protein
MYSAVHLGASASISTTVVTAYLNPAAVSDMSGTLIYSSTLDSGTYNLFIGVPSGSPNPLALVSGDVITLNIPMADKITGDKITARTVLKLV